MATRLTPYLNFREGTRGAMEKDKVRFGVASMVNISGRPDQ